jgi:hypothetical protein
VLGPTTGRRPGDVTLPLWSDGAGLAIDIAVTSPLQKASVRLFEPCEEYAATQKHGKYDKDFKNAHYAFGALVWESLGAINAEGEDILRQIFSFTAKKLHREFSSFCGRSWAQFSCCLQRCVSQSILMRIEGHEFRDALPKSAPKVAREPVLLPPPRSVAVSLSSVTDTLASTSASNSCTLTPVNITLSQPSLSMSTVLPTLTPSAALTYTPTHTTQSPPLPPLVVNEPPANITCTSTPVLKAIVSLPRVNVACMSTPLPVPPLAVGGVFTIRSDGLCGYHCLAALSALIVDPRALDSGFFPCSHDVLPLTRKHILDTYDRWWAFKREFCESDEEMEAREAKSHVDGSSQVFRDRVNGGDIGQVGGLWAWPCDLALYALKTDVLIVLVDTQRMSATSTLECDETKACEELWFDPLVETPKRRVVCFVTQTPLSIRCSTDASVTFYLRPRLRLGPGTPFNINVYQAAHSRRSTCPYQAT